MKEWGEVLCQALDESETARLPLVAKAGALTQIVLDAMDALRAVSDGCTTWMTRTGWRIGKPSLEPTVERQQAAEDLVRMAMDVVNGFQLRSKPPKSGLSPPSRRRSTPPSVVVLHPLPRLPWQTSTKTSCRTEGARTWGDGRDESGHGLPVVEDGGSKREPAPGLAAQPSPPPGSSEPGDHPLAAVEVVETVAGKPRSCWRTAPGALRMKCRPWSPTITREPPSPAGIGSLRPQVHPPHCPGTGMT